MPLPIDILIRTQADLAAVSKTEQALGGLAKIGPAVAAAVSAAVAAIAGLTVHAIESADAAAKAASRMGILVQSFTALTYVTSGAGVAAGEFQASMRTLADNVVNASTGNEQARRSFEDLGVALEDQSGALKSADGLLLEVADKFEQMPDGINKTALATQLFGRAGQALIPVLNQGSAAIKDQMREAEDFGVVVGPKFAANAAQFGDNMSRFHALFKGLFLQLADALLPEFNKFIEAILRFIRETGIHKAVLQSLIDIYKTFASALTTAKGSLEAYVGFWAAFAGNLSVTGSRIEALAAATATWDAALDGAAKRIQEINALKPEEAGAQTTKNEEQKKTNEALRAELDLQRKLVDLKIENNRVIAEGIRQNSSLPPEERQRRLNESLGTEIKLIDEKRRLLSDAAFQDEVFGKNPTADVNYQALDLADRKARLDAKARQAPDRNSFGVAFNNVYDDLQTRLPTAAEGVARAFSSTVGSAIDGLSNGISGLIQGTLTWGQALRNIGSSILTGVINAISRMFAEWIAGRALAAARNIFFAQTEGAAETAAKAPGAILTSISSYGAAAAIGLAAVVAALAAFAFNEGGMVPGAPSSRDNRLAHVATGEYITRASAVQYYGPGLFEALNSFQIPRGSLEGMRISVPPSFARSSFASGGLVSAMPAASSQVNVAPAPVTVVVVKDQRELEDFMQSHRFGQIVVQHVTRQRSNLGIRS